MCQVIEYKKEDFLITTDFKKIDFDAVCSLLGKSYWANSRERDVNIKSFKNSLNFFNQ